MNKEKTEETEKTENQLISSLQQLQTRNQLIIKSIEYQFATVANSESTDY